MKVLFIASNSYDYLQDIVFSGLVKVLGPSSVHHWRANPKFIFPIKEYPKNLGFHSQAWRTAKLFAPQPGKYDAVIIGACKPDAFRTFLSIAHSISSSVPVILLDGGDREEIGGDLGRLGQMDLFTKAKNTRDFDWIFKREYFLEKQYETNVRPLPFGFNLSRLPALQPSNKKYDVTFWAVESHSIRTQALQLLKDRFDCADNGTTSKQTFSNYIRKGGFYLQELVASKIALNFRGGGWDTLRYWEVPAVGGFMISQRPGIHIPNNFEHEKHVIFCKDDLSDLLPRCEYYLKNEKQREAIALAAKNHLCTFHTDVARARAILEVVKK
jgi:hypothetical protein